MIGPPPRHRGYRVDANDPLWEKILFSVLYVVAMGSVVFYIIFMLGLMFRWWGF